MKLPCRKLPFSAKRSALDTGEVIRVASRPASKGWSLDDIAELLEGKYPRDRFFVKDGQTFLFVRSPCFMLWKSIGLSAWASYLIRNVFLYLRRVEQR